MKENNEKIWLDVVIMVREVERQLRYTHWRCLWGVHEDKTIHIV